MANEKRLRALAVGGLVEDNPLTAAGTALASAGLAAMPAVGTTEHAAITFDPDGVFGAPEIAWITAHTAAATSATIARGKEGTTARQHDRDVPWIHGPTPRDFDGLLVTKRYNPSLVTVSIGAGSIGDLDATNLVVPDFVVPPSGVVKVELSAVTYSGDTNQWHQWGIRDSGNVLQGDGWVACGVSTMQTRALAKVFVSGLTAGATITGWKWSQTRTAGSGTSNTQYGGAAGPAVIEVVAVPGS